MLLTCVATATAVYIAVPQADPPALIPVDPPTEITIAGDHLWVRDPDVDAQWAFALSPIDAGKPVEEVVARCARTARMPLKP